MECYDERGAWIELGNTFRAHRVCRTLNWNRTEPRSGFLDKDAWNVFFFSNKSIILRRIERREKKFEDVESCNHDCPTL